MKDYIVYVKGVEQKDTVKAANMVAAEKKAQKKFPTVSKYDIQVVYTEL